MLKTCITHLLLHLHIENSPFHQLQVVLLFVFILRQGFKIPSVPNSTCKKRGGHLQEEGWALASNAV